MGLVSPNIAAELKAIRTAKNVQLKPSPYVSGKIRKAIDGSVEDVRVRNYQSIGVLNLMKMTEFVLGDEPGLGKTLQVMYAYSYLRHWYPNLKLLWVGPKSTLPEKKDEVNVMLKESRCTYIEGGWGKAHRKGQWNQIRAAGIEIVACNYHTVMTDYDLIAKTYKGVPLMVVFDEAQALSNIHTKTHKACKFIAKKAVRRVAVTATILRNRLDEVYGVLKVIIPDLFPSKAAYEGMFYRYEDEWVGKKIMKVLKGYRQLDVFRRMVAPYYIGRTPEDVGGELPEVVYRKAVLDMAPWQADIYDRCILGMLSKTIIDPLSGEEVSVPVKGPLARLMYSMLITNSPQMIEDYSEEKEMSSKEKQIIEWLKNDIEGEKVVIFSFFKKWLYRLKGLIKKHLGKDVLMITGDVTDANERKKINDEFNQSTDPNKEICLITTAGGVGINLTKSKYIIMGNLPWSYGDLRQIIGRIRRLGSEHDKIICMMPINKGTVDEHVFGTLQSKQNLSKALFRDSMDSLDEAEVSNVLNDLMESIIGQVKSRVA